MNENERKQFVAEELEAIYEEIDNSINQLILARRFLQTLVTISKGAEPENLVLAEIINKNRFSI